MSPCDVSQKGNPAPCPPIFHTNPKPRDTPLSPPEPINSLSLSPLHVTQPSSHKTSPYSCPWR